MHGRLILTLSALILFAVGAAALFAADELARLFDAGSSKGLALAIQLAGCGLLGFAALNWMSRGIRIGGIYARPIGIGNLLLFTTTSLTVGKAALAGTLPIVVTAVGVILALLAIAFAWLVFVHDPLAEPVPTRSRG
jgi:hypothetical protein